MVEVSIGLGWLGAVGSTVGIGILRSVAGWFENALEDGKVTKFELGQLGSTVIRIGLTSAALFYGVRGIFGIDIGVVGASAGTFFADWIVKKLTSKRVLKNKG